MNAQCTLNRLGPCILLSELVKSVLCGLSDPHEMILFEDMLCGIEPFSEKIPTLESEKKKGQKRNFHINTYIHISTYILTNEVMHSLRRDYLCSKKYSASAKAVHILWAIQLI